MRFVPIRQGGKDGFRGQIVGAYQDAKGVTHGLLLGPSIFRRNYQPLTAAI